MAPDATPLAWAEWGQEPFARAARERRPVLLSIVTSWSDACDRLDRETCAHPRVQALASSALVAVRVDADRRPDLAARYGLGAWPTVVFLGPEGALLAGGTFVEPARMIAVIESVVATFNARHVELREAASRVLSSPVEVWPRTATADAVAPAALAARAATAFDERLGGFGPAPWFPPADLLLFLVIYATRTGDEQSGRMAARVLEAMAESMVDPDDGGVYRAAAGPGWQGADEACLLDANARVLRAAAAAHAADLAPHAASIAHGIVRFLRASLGEASDGFRLGRRASRDGGGLPSDAREWRLVDANARACRALLSAAEAFDDPGFAELGVNVLDAIVGAAYEAGAGVAHLLEPRPRVRGLLADQVAVGAALLEASGVSGRAFYLDLAEELLRSAMARLWNEEMGCFADRVRTTAGGGDIGLLSRPVFPLAENAEAASLLHHLAARRDDPKLAQRAETLLGALAHHPEAAGLDAAPYALAVMDVLGDWS